MNYVSFIIYYFNYFFKVIKERDEIIQKINENLILIWRKKLAIDKALNNRNNKKEISDIVFTLNQSLEDFEINKIFISSFLNRLWNSPEIISNILIYSDIKDVQSNLAPFIVHNFYCNYLSGNYMENNLIYVITIMLKDEIDNMKNIEQFDTFLVNTKCGYILEELRKIPDIQIYFKNLIFKIVEKLERKYNNEIIFEISKMIKEINKLKNEKKENKIKLNQENDNIHNNQIEKQEETIITRKNDNDKTFIIKYFPNLSITEFEKRAEKANKENNKILFQYYDKVKNFIKSINKPDIFSNNSLMKQIFDSYDSNELFYFYQKEFISIIELIEQLIVDIMKSIIGMPNSIKYICKIISILIKNKFQDISLIEENKFISKFIIEKLFIPIISNPSYNALISDFIISKHTIQNISLINSILTKLFTADLFKNNYVEGYYTPFNWFIINNLETIINFFTKIKTINLPKFIEDYANNKLSKDYKYEYFIENKEVISTNITICFTIDNLYCLLNGLSKYDIIFNDDNGKKLLKAMERLKTDKAKKEINDVDQKKKNLHLEKLKKSKKKNLKEIILENFYLYNEKIIEKKYENIFLIKNIFPNCFEDEEKNQKIDEKEKLIKVKNDLCKALKNLELSNFKKESNSDLTKILEEIKIDIDLHKLFLKNNEIPFVWYIDSILDNINNIPEEYKINNFKKLFEEINKNLNDSINGLDFETLFLYKNNFSKFKLFMDSIKV